MKKNSLLITALAVAFIVSSAPVNAFNVKESFQKAKSAFYNKYIYSERYCIKKEEGKLDRNLKTFVLDKNAPTMMHPEKHQFMVGDYEYSTATWYNRGTWKAIVEVKFVDGPCVKIIKPVRALDYTLLSKYEISSLKNILTIQTKQPQLENSSTSITFKNGNKEFALTVFYPSNGQKVNNAVRRAVANEDWATLQEILLMYKPVVYLTSLETKPTEVYQVKNFDPLIKHIVTGLKRQKFSYK
jgi:hypothetical protein